jgi:hypothetical protein
MQVSSAPSRDIGFIKRDLHYQPNLYSRVKHRHLYFYKSNFHAESSGIQQPIARLIASAVAAVTISAFVLARKKQRFENYE